MRFPSLHKLHAQKYKTSLSHRFRQCSGKPGRWVIFHIPFCAVSARGAAVAALRLPECPLFQFTPLREGRLELRTAQLKRRQFQFTPLREGRPEPPGRAVSTAYFNSRPCERGDGRTARQGGEHRLFQFTPLREGRRAWAASLRLRRHYFNSRPCERGDDRGCSTSRQKPCYFNSRPCERGDPCPSVSNVSMEFQFTPLREGRPGAVGLLLQPPYFNSRPCERGDFYEKMMEAENPENFNSRPCERGDLFFRQSRTIFSYFNSRPCERGDVDTERLFYFCRISIHAPARGATEMHASRTRFNRISIHAPARGATYHR